MSAAFGLAGLAVAAIWAAVPPVGQPKPGYPTGALTALIVIGSAAGLLTLFPLLRLGWFKRRIVLDLRVRGIEQGRLVDLIPSATAQIPIPDQPRWLHVDHLTITNRSKNDSATLDFALQVEGYADYYPHRFHDQLSWHAKHTGPAVEPHWANDPLTGPLNLGPQESAEVALFFFEQADRTIAPLYPPEGGGGWDDGVPLLVTELIAGKQELASLGILRTTRIRFA